MLATLPNSRDTFWGSEGYFWVFLFKPLPLVSCQRSNLSYSILKNLLDLVIINAYDYYYSFLNPIWVERILSRPGMMIDEPYAVAITFFWSISPSHFPLHNIACYIWAIPLMLLSKAIYNHSFTYSHDDGVNQAGRQPACQEQPGWDALLRMHAHWPKKGNMGSSLTVVSSNISVLANLGQHSMDGLSFLFRQCATQHLKT